MNASERLGSLLLDEGFAAIGWQSRRWLRWLLEPICWPSALRFGEVAATFDSIVAQSGLGAAARWLLDQFAPGYQVSGAGNIPSGGPLLIASNHPGAFDLIVISASLPRDDLKILASDVPFARNLPHTAHHLIYVPPDTYGRMKALRGAIRHLHDGGSLLMFPSGLVDPDPAVLPGAREALQGWSPSLELCVRQAPATQVQVTIVSGVLAESSYRHPLVRLQKPGWEQRKLAEFIQLVQQFIFGHKFNLVPRAAFGHPFQPAGLAGSTTPGSLLQSIIARAEALLALIGESGLAKEVGHRLDGASAGLAERRQAPGILDGPQ